MNSIVSAMLAIPYATAIVLLCAELLGVRAQKLPASPRLHPLVWVLAILGTFVFQIATYRYAATHGAELPQWRLTMPLPIVYLNSANVDVSAAILLACGLVQSYAMLALFRSKPSRGVVIAGAGALIGLALVAPVLTSADLYSNVGYALLGPNNAYTPPAVAFPGEYFLINQWWGTPIVPAPYGPAWLAIDRAVTATGSNLLGKMLALRCFCAVLFVSAAALVRWLGLPRRFAVITLLNPGLAMQFVSNAHNDIFAIVAILGAAVLMRRNRPWWGALLLVVAGSIKLPYAVLALPILAGVNPVWRRFAIAGAALALAAGVSWVFGGSAYFQALVTHAAPMSSAAGWHTGAVIVALLLVAAAFFAKRRLQSAVWLLPPIGGFYPIFVYPWYLAWGIPYALNRHRNLAYLLILFPFVAVLVDQLFVRVWTIVLVFPIVLATALALSAWRPAESAFAFVRRRSVT